MRLLNLVYDSINNLQNTEEYSRLLLLNPGTHLNYVYDCSAEEQKMYHVYSLELELGIESELKIYSKKFNCDIQALYSFDILKADFYIETAENNLFSFTLNDCTHIQFSGNIGRNLEYISVVFDYDSTDYTRDVYLDGLLECVSHGILSDVLEINIAWIEHSDTLEKFLRILSIREAQGLKPAVLTMDTEYYDSVYDFFNLVEELGITNLYNLNLKMWDNYKYYHRATDFCARLHEYVNRYDIAILDESYNKVKL